MIHEHGEGLTVSYARAIDLYERAFELDSRSAINNLFKIYDHGEGVWGRLLRAIELFYHVVRLTMIMRSLIYSKNYTN